MTFEDLQLSSLSLKNVVAAGYTAPTPIQEKAIGSVLEGRDVMGLAQTGTGKTAAFLLPMIDRLTKTPGVRGKVRALIVAPTRELATQIHEEFVKLGRGSRLRGTVIFGGVGFTPQVNKLKDGVDVVVACPGRLLDHVGQGNIDLSHVETLVLDEADRMFDMGFLPDVRRIVAKLPAGRQTLLFSATMPSDIRRLADEVLKNPITVQVSHSAPADTVSHAVYPVHGHLKTALLTEVLTRTETGSVLVFTRTKHRAKKVAEHLGKSGYAATALQGNMAQNKRQAAMDGFKDGTYQVMVATDIAARGIDVSKVSHVINYDMPDTAEAYTHRVGRTGRAERTGDAFTFATPEDAGMLAAIERLLGSKPVRCKLDGFDYAVPAPPVTEQPRGPHGGRPGGRSVPRTTAGGGSNSRPARPRSQACDSPRGARGRTEGGNV